jgi:ATP-dependent Clp protease ATP-binding subunit ClpA
VFVDGLDSFAGRLTPATQRVVDRALEESLRRGHPLLATAHMWYAVAHTEWDLFARAMRDAEVNPHDVLRAIDEHLRTVPSFSGSAVACRPRRSSSARWLLTVPGARAVRGVKPPTCCSRSS